MTRYSFQNKPSTRERMERMHLLVKLDYFMLKYLENIPSMSADGCRWAFDKHIINVNFGESTLESWESYHLGTSQLLSANLSLSLNMKSFQLT